jgi:hypothetical protein
MERKALQHPALFSRTKRATEEAPFRTLENLVVMQTVAYSWISSKQNLI